MRLLPRKWTWEVRTRNIMGGYDTPMAFRFKWMATAMAWLGRPRDCDCEPSDYRCVWVARSDERGTNG